MKEQEFNKPDSSVPSEASEMISAKEPIKLSCLFFTFLKLGSYSFGGFMSLVAAVRRELVEKSNALTEEKLVEGISLASLLPGPVAVNVVAFTGNHLRGIRGAAVCMAGVILPSFLLILALSVVYFKFNRLPVAGQLFSGVLPAVAAIILSAAVGYVEEKHSELEADYHCPDCVGGLPGFKVLHDRRKRSCGFCRGRLLDEFERPSAYRQNKGEKKGFVIVSRPIGGLRFCGSVLRTPLLAADCGFASLSDDTTPNIPHFFRHGVERIWRRVHRYPGHAKIICGVLALALR